MADVTSPADGDLVSRQRHLATPRESSLDANDIGRRARPLPSLLGRIAAGAGPRSRV